MLLIRYGVIPEVARCVATEADPVARGMQAVVQTHRGLELAKILEILRPPAEPGQTAPSPSAEFVRLATTGDLERHAKILSQCRQDFFEWNHRIAEWGLDLQLIDLERTLDENKLILYVLNERGPECTKLALQAAAAGLGIIEVQPVSQDGLVTQSQGGGGCGSCGCH